MDVLNSIWTFLQSAFMFLENLVASLLQAILVLGTSAGVPLIVSTWVAPVIGASVVVVGAIAIIKLIVGWGNS